MSCPRDSRDIPGRTRPDRAPSPHPALDVADRAEEENMASTDKRRTFADPGAVDAALDRSRRDREAAAALQAAVEEQLRRRPALATPPGRRQV
jgi:hypothetical protein